MNDDYGNPWEWDEEKIAKEDRKAKAKELLQGIQEYTQDVQQRHGAQLQQQLYGEALKEVARELNTTPEQLLQTDGFMDPEESKTRFKQQVKNWYKTSHQISKTRPRGLDGRFISKAQPQQQPQQQQSGFPGYVHTTGVSEDRKTKMAEVAEKRRKGEISGDDALDQMVRASIWGDPISKYGE